MKDTVTLDLEIVTVEELEAKIAPESTAGFLE